MSRPNFSFQAGPPVIKAEDPKRLRSQAIVLGLANLMSVLSGDPHVEHSTTPAHWLGQVSPWAPAIYLHWPVTPVEEDKPDPAVRTFARLFDQEAAQLGIKPTIKRTSYDHERADVTYVLAGVDNGYGDVQPAVVVEFSGKVEAMEGIWAIPPKVEADAEPF